MKLRKFKAEDLKAVLELFHETVHSVGAKYYSADQVNAWSPQEGVDEEKWLQSLQKNYSYVIEEEGRIIGFGDMQKDGYVDRLFVHKSHQGRGAALRLYRQMENDARNLGLKEITGEASAMLMPLALRYGFEVLEKQRKSIRGIELINYKVRKKL